MWGTKNVYKFILAIFPVLCFCGGLCCGRLPLSPAEVLGALTGGDVSPEIITVVVFMRLPRLLLACLVGSSLAVAGCSYQGLFANPLATPDTLGVASGASFGAVLAILAGWPAAGIFVSAVTCGLAAVLLTGMVTESAGRGRITAVLAGIMIGSLFSSLVALVKFTADTESELPTVTYWLLGSLEGANYDVLVWGSPLLLFGLGLLYCLRWQLNFLPLDRDEALSTGVNIDRLRKLTVFCATLLTAVSVALCGQVGWVGLIIPHLCRMAFGSNHRLLVPASVSVGAGFMTVVDTLARSLTVQEIPVSILTAIVGAPFFLYLLKKGRGWNL